MKKLLALFACLISLLNTSHAEPKTPDSEDEILTQTKVIPINPNKNEFYVIANNETKSMEGELQVNERLHHTKANGAKKYSGTHLSVAANTKLAKTLKHNKRTVLLKNKPLVPLQSELNSKKYAANNKKLTLS